MKKVMILFLICALQNAHAAQEEEPKKDTIILLSFATAFAAQSLEQQLTKCLSQEYQLDPAAISNIKQKLNPLVANNQHRAVLHEFILKSAALKIPQTPASRQEMGPEDPIFKSPKSHEVVFENSKIRILWGDTRPSEFEPMHMHYWKSLLLIIQGSQFLITNKDGSNEEGFWPIGTYDLPPDTQPAEYTNIGDTDYSALRFEIK